MTYNVELRGAPSLSVKLGATGVGEWCAPGPAKEQAKRWLLLYEDANIEYVTFDNEASARAAFGRAESIGWNCHLFEHVKRTVPNVKLSSRPPENEETKK